jgi:HEAT repeat protein
MSTIRNPEVTWIHKNDTILALRWLPESLLREQANEISQLLIEVADGKYTDSETDDFLKWFSDEEEIRRNSLYTLGHISSFVNHRLKKEIFTNIKLLSHSSAATIRMGAAMALRVLGGSYTFPTEFVFLLVELLQDEDPRVRHWAASAAGHRIADGKIPKKSSDFIIQPLLKATEKELDPHARAGVAYGLRILLESNRLNESLQDQAQEAMGKLVSDVNFQVRRLATGQKITIN